MLLTRRIYVIFFDFLFQIRGCMQYRDRIENRRYINNNIEKVKLEKERWRKRLFELSNYGTQYSEFIREFLDSELVSSKDLKVIEETPIVLAVVKDEMFRIKIFLKHYRKLGVKRFGILDDNSKDGTREFLLEQPDVILFTANKNYTSYRRLAWINKMISYFGSNKWFLILDADEFLYYHNCDKIDINTLINALQKNGETSAKAIMLDMFAKDELYSKKIEKPEDVFEICSMFCPIYYFEKSLYDYKIKGGGRELMFQTFNKKSAPLLSKYPLIYINEKDVVISSHYNFPFCKNNKKSASLILKHYKFLPGDKEKYKERIAKKNFSNNSEQYAIYDGDTKKNYAEIIGEMSEFKDYNSVKNIKVFNQEIK